MIKTLAALVAFFCLGLAILSLAPLVTPKPGPRVSFLKASPKVLQNIPYGVAVVYDEPATSSSGSYATNLGPVAKPYALSKAELRRIIAKYARKYGVDKNLVRAVIQQESGGDCQAVSPKGAQGVMQLMPATAEILGVDDPFDPEENIKGGVRYLKHCLNRFNHNTALALAAYNAGPQAVEKYKGIPPYKETKNYVSRVLKAYRDNS